MYPRHFRAWVGEKRTIISSYLWLHRYFIPLRRQMERYGITSLQPLNTHAWHRGSRYFRGVHEGTNPVFIKIDGHYRLLENEILATHAYHTAGNNAPEVLRHSFNEEFPFAAFTWIDGHPLNHSQNRRRISTAILVPLLVELLDNLHLANIVHRDISPANLLISWHSDNSPPTIHPIDFAFAVVHGRSISDERVPLHELISLGTGYKPSPQKWDDAFACQQVVCEITGNNTKFDDIVTRIGRMSWPKCTSMESHS